MRFQRTLKTEISFSGIGLHSGRHVKVRLRPSSRDSGIVFYRIDKESCLRADVASVIDSAYATTIGNDDAKVRTVEHLLSAFSGLGIDNAIVELDGPEIPILDGSAMEIVDLILKAGIAKQGKRATYMRITNPVRIEDGHSSVTVFPYNGRKITFRINFDHGLLGEQTLSLDINEETYVREIAPARTFGFLKDVQYLMSKGLARGGSLSNAIILTESKILNSSGLRFKDEFVRHKILDSIGDFSLIGMPIHGHIIADKAGHSTNIRFLKQLINRPDCWEIISETDYIPSMMQI
ncbi:MAG: UDP-3-O-acyl-N-acetylglucosamine deacetylase [Thermodesulfovibrionales bacterium]